MDLNQSPARAYKEAGLRVSESYAEVQHEHAQRLESARRERVQGNVGVTGVVILKQLSK